MQAKLHFRRSIIMVTGGHMSPLTIFSYVNRVEHLILRPLAIWVSDPQNALAQKFTPPPPISATN